jgi:hypothetical protein
VHSTPIKRTRAGDFRVQLSVDERDLLRRLTGELEELLASERQDPSLRRLHPRAYEDDEQGESEFRSLMGTELHTQRLENLRVLEETAERERLDADELESWLIALNDLRLVLGTRLDVSEDAFASGFDTSAPRAYELAVYAFLTWLQESAVAATTSTLPDKR